MGRMGLSLGALALLGGIVGCSQGPSGTTGDDQDVVGVTDLKALETELGLELDKYENGAWSRAAERLEAGPCYAAKKGPNAPDPQNWEFRRYKKGAAFFKKLNHGEASGDKRPVTCVDVDLFYGEEFGETIALDGFGLDSALRYALGRPTGYDAGMSQLYFAFSDGAIKIRTPDSYCGLYFGPGSVPRDATSIDPGTNAFRDAYWPCADAGGDETECYMNAMKSCETAVEKDLETESLDRPGYLGAYVTEMTWRDLQPVQAMLAYKYAWKKAKESDLYSLSDDPMGKYLGAESYGDGPGYWHAARYEHLDVHHTILNTGEPNVQGEEAVYITPKSSDKAIAESAIVACKRPLSPEGEPVASYTCTGL